MIKYFDEEKYSPPIDTAVKCECCGQNLGAQNPGYICNHCMWVKYNP